MRRLTKSCLVVVVSAIASIVGARTPVLANPPETPAAPTAEALFAFHAAAAKTLRTAIIEETVSETSNRMAEEFKATLSEHLREARTAALSGPDMTDAARTQIEQQFKNLEARSGGMATTARLNATRSLDRKVQIDLAGGLTRFDDRDLRDLQKLCEENGLSDADRLSLDQTASRIFRSDGEFRLHEFPTNKLAAVEPHPRYSVDQESLRFGLLPEWARAAEIETTIQNDPASTTGDVALEGRRQGKLAYRAVLSRDTGFRVTKFEQFYGEDQLSSRTECTDYRLVNEQYTPFRVMTTHPESGKPEHVLWRQEQIIRSAKLNDNAPIDAAVFDIPRDYIIDVIAGNKLPNEISRTAPRADGASPAPAKPDVPRRVLSASQPGTYLELVIIKWQMYARGFSSQYKLEDEQRQKADEIMREAEEEARAYWAKHKEKMEKLLASITEIRKNRATTQPDQEKKLAELEKDLTEPLLRIFDAHIAERLNSLPTRAQRKDGGDPEKVPDIRPFTIYGF